MSVQPTTQIQNPTNLEWFTGELDSRQEFRNGTVTLDPDPKRFGAYHPIENGVTQSEIVCGFERCTTQLKHYRSYRNHLRKVHGFTFSMFVPTRAASVPAPAAPSSDVAVSALLGLAAQPTPQEDLSLNVSFQELDLSDTPVTTCIFSFADIHLAAREKKTTTWALRYGIFQGGFMSVDQSSIPDAGNGVFLNLEIGDVHVDYHVGDYITSVEVDQTCAFSGGSTEAFTLFRQHYPDFTSDCIFECRGYVVIGQTDLTKLRATSGVGSLINCSLPPLKPNCIWYRSQLCGRWFLKLLANYGACWHARHPGVKRVELLCSYGHGFWRHHKRALETSTPPPQT